MFVLLLFYLHSLLSSALGQTIPKTDHPSVIPDLEGDLFFLLDSSGSVTYDEFSKVKKFIEDLLQPFKFGPQDVQASVVQISTNPTLEFPLNQYSSSKDVQNAIQKIRQRMGDTNTGKAVNYVKENLYAEDFGSRSDVPKVLVWVTDGLSTDDISWPMKLLKDMGVSIFIISTTGRGNFRELSAAASEPNEKFLKFVDKDDLGIITKELRNSIIELIKAKRLHALNITTTSFLLTWPRLLSKEIGHYVLEYAPVADSKKIRRTLQGDQTSLEITGLTANTTYEVTLYPESNVEYLQPQTIKVSTLQEVKEERNLEALDITTTGFVLSWTKLSGDTGVYVVEYSSLSDPKSKLQKMTSVEETSVVLSTLTPNATYQVTLLPDSSDPNMQPETIQVSTLPDYIQERNLQILGITSTSFNASWSRLIGDMGRYFLDYALLSYPRRKTRKTLYGDQTSAMVSGLIPNTTYLVTFIPESKLEALQSQTLPVSTLPDHTHTRNLQARDITSSGFLLTWTRLPGDKGRYVLQYIPVSDPGMIQQKIVHGDETSVAVSGLKSGTTYQITLIPEHSAMFAPPEVIMVSTQSEQVHPRNFHVINVTATSFSVTWSRTPGDWGRYIVEYSPVSDPSGTLQKTLSGDDNTALISNLAPNTTYQVSLTHESGVQSGRIQVSTLIDHTHTRNLQARDITSSGFLLTWTRLPGDEGRYVLQYIPVSDPGMTHQKIVHGDETSVAVSGLKSGTTYQITLIPEHSASFAPPEVIMVSTQSEQVHPRNFHVNNVTATSFLVTWSRAPGDWGHYIVEYSPVSDPSGTLQKTLSGNDNTALISNLAPNTTYQVSLTHESGVQYGRIQVSTLIDHTQKRHLQARDITSSGFLLTWTRLPGDEGRYVLQYIPVSDPGMIQQKIVHRDETSVAVSGLKSGTTYQITLIPEHSATFAPPEVIMVSTQSEQVHPRNFQAINVTATSFLVTWSRAPGDWGRYIVEYSPVSDPSGTLQKTLSGNDNTALISNLAPNTTYQVSLTQESGVQYGRIQVSTLIEHTQKRNLQARDITSSGFLLTWTRLPGDEGRYVLQYIPVSDPGMIQQKIVHGDETSVAVSGLKSGTTYQITLIPEHSATFAPPEVITVSTQSEQVHPRNFHMINVTATSFLVTWSRAPGDWGRYIVEYSPVSDPSGTLQKASSGGDNTALISNLAPNTTYQVSLTHESGVQYGRIQVSTLIDLIKARNLHARDRTSNSFQLSWSKLPGDTGRYVLEYAPLKDLSKVIKNILYGDQTSMIFHNLVPDTIYQVTFSPDSKGQISQVQNIRVSTLPQLAQQRSVYARDITTSSLQLGWSRMPGDKGPYVVEFVLESDPRRKLRKSLPFDETNIIFSNLSPNTEYRAVVFSESNIQHVPPNSIHVSTLEEQLSPAHILISDPDAHSFRVSWGPSLDSVAGYEIQYGPMASNIVRTLQVDSRVNSTVLENLKPNTTYLVTVSAIFKSGGEKALSAIACTEQDDTKVKFLHFKDLGSNSVTATWGSADGEVQGYRVRCRRQAGRSSVISVAPQTHSIHLTDVAEGSMNKICVVPIYKNGEGKNLCRKIQIQPGTSADSYSRISTPVKEG
ncbi:von Willebrand factor A domain-containing protein 1 [Ranitomeya variabilis]|uniref:von Willebrand factor A domain-containing protein 1 n=1 Tax=Ranitomeya variabilis TaxID=490064 RepID=UPI0040571028